MTSVVAINVEVAVLDRLPGKRAISRLNPQDAAVLDACTAHLGVPIALYRVADWGGGNLEANVQQRPSPAKEYRADGVHCRSSRCQQTDFSKMLSRGASRSRVGRNQHSGRASGPKSPS